MLLCYGLGNQVGNDGADAIACALLHENFQLKSISVRGEVASLPRQSLASYPLTGIHRERFLWLLRSNVGQCAGTCEL